MKQFSLVPFLFLLFFYFNFNFVFKFTPLDYFSALLCVFWSFWKGKKPLMNWWKYCVALWMFLQHSPRACKSKPVPDVHFRFKTSFLSHGLRMLPTNVFARKHWHAKDEYYTALVTKKTDTNSSHTHQKTRHKESCFSEETWQKSCSWLEQNIRSYKLSRDSTAFSGKIHNSTKVGIKNRFSKGWQSFSCAKLASFLE